MIRPLRRAFRLTEAPAPRRPVVRPTVPCCTPATRAMDRLADECTSTEQILDDFLAEQGTAPAVLGLDDAEAELEHRLDRGLAS